MQDFIARNPGIVSTPASVWCSPSRYICRQRLIEPSAADLKGEELLAFMNVRLGLGFWLARWRNFPPSAFGSGALAGELITFAQCRYNLDAIRALEVERDLDTWNTIKHTTRAPSSSEP